MKLVEFGAQSSRIAGAREPLLHRSQVLLQILDFEARWLVCDHGICAAGMRESIVSMRPAM